MDALRRTFLLPRAGGGGGGVEKPYIAAPSVGHEIGVMFGAFVAMITGALLFYIWWRFKLVREIHEEDERIQDLKSKGLFDDVRRESAISERKQVEKRHGK